MINLDRHKPPVQTILIVAGCILAAGLLAAAAVMERKMAFLGKGLKSNQALLEDALPGFSESELKRLNLEIGSLKEQAAGLSLVFDSKEYRGKESYDINLSLVEVLSGVNVFLKEKAAENKVLCVALWPEAKISSEKIALPAYRQLLQLKEILSLGIGYGLNFTAIDFVGVDSIEASLDMRVVKTRVEANGLPQRMMDFILDICEMVPVVMLESLLLKVDAGHFYLDMTIGSVFLEPRLLNFADSFVRQPQGKAVANRFLKQMYTDLRPYADSLRSSNPFYIPQQVEENILPIETSQSQEEAKTRARFSYRGKARLKSTDVAVIEDAHSRKTYFLAQGDYCGDFVLKSFDKSIATLAAVSGSLEILLKRENK